MENENLVAFLVPRLSGPPPWGASRWASAVGAGAGWN